MGSEPDIPEGAPEEVHTLSEEDLMYEEEEIEAFFQSLQDKFHWEGGLDV